MLNEWERGSLEDLERRLHVEDPAFARRFGADDGWSRWRSAWRWGTSLPALLLVVALCVTSFAIGVSSLGLLLLVWAVVGGTVRLRRSGRNGRRTPDPAARPEPA